MVARFVEQHDVRVHEENARQRDAHLPAAREGAHVPVHHLLAEAEAGEDLVGAALESVAVQLLEACLHLAVALDDRVHLGRPVRIGQGVLELLQLGGDRAHGAGAVHHLGDDAAAGHLADILAEVADRDAPVGGNLAFVGLLLAGDHPEERRLAGAVRTDKPDLLAPLESGGRFDKEDLLAVLPADFVEAYHASAGAREGGPRP